MKTITSISGGKTSAYLAKHYPTDYNIFALVRIEDSRCTPKDKTLVQKISTSELEVDAKQDFVPTKVLWQKKF